MSYHWRRTLNEWTDAEIVALFIKFTPDSVKEILDREDPPSFQTLLKTAWQHTTEPGVYMKLICPVQEDTASHVYIGSATNLEGGLNYRRSEHEKPVKPEEKSYNYRLMLEQGVKRRLEFGTLFLVPWSHNLSEDNVAFTRRICLLAEAVYCSILRGYMTTAPEQLRIACPYGNPSSVFAWEGACSHSCLMESQRIHYRYLKGDTGYRSALVVRTGTESADVREMRLTCLRQLYHEKRAALTKEELADMRETGRLNMRKLRAQNPEKYRKTEVQKRRWREKARLYAKEYRIKNAAEIRARQEALSEDDKAEWRAHRAAQMRGYRAKKALLQPKPKHIVPERNVKRNATRTQQRKKDEFHNMKSMLQTRINRARKAYNQVLQANSAHQTIVYEAKVRLAIAEVDRYEFNLKNGIKVRHSPCQEFLQLAQEARGLSKSAAYLYDNGHSELDHGSSEPQDNFDIDMDLSDDGSIESDCSANHFDDFTYSSFDEGDDDAIQESDVEMSVM